MKDELQFEFLTEKKSRIQTKVCCLSVIACASILILPVAEAFL